MTDPSPEIGDLVKESEKEMKRQAEEQKRVDEQKRGSKR